MQMYKNFETNQYFLKDLNSIFFIDDELILNRIHHELFKKEEFKAIAS